MNQDIHPNYIYIYIYFFNFFFMKITLGNPEFRNSLQNFHQSKKCRCFENLWGAVIKIAAEFSWNFSCCYYQIFSCMFIFLNTDQFDVCWLFVTQSIAKYREESRILNTGKSIFLDHGISHQSITMPDMRIIIETSTTSTDIW